MTENSFLRPVLTKVMIQYLERGDSINIYGPEGIGKTRLLEDIRDGAPENIRAVVVSFRGFQKSHDGFCETLQNAAEIGGKPLKSLSAVIGKLRETGKRVFLLIDDFHYFPDNPNLDPAYNQKFVDGLNAIRNTAGVSLAVVTREAVSKFLIFINGKPEKSILHFSPHEISSLQQKDIRKELDRRFDKKMLSKKEKDEMAVHLRDQFKNYRLLEYYTGKIVDGADSGLEFDARLRRWERLCGYAECDSVAKLPVQLTVFMKKWMLILTPFRSEFMRIKKLFEGPLAYFFSLLKKKEN